MNDRISIDPKKLSDLEKHNGKAGVFCHPWLWGIHAESIALFTSGKNWRPPLGGALARSSGDIRTRRLG
jgi:hypothetical protein